MTEGPMLLERGPELERLLAELASVAGNGAGHLSLVSGEAGIGKTALVDAFAAQLPAGRVLRGACDPLLTPRPLGPLIDIAERAGGELAELVEGDASAGALVSALARTLGRGATRVIVLEDLHWADEATLDVVRLLVRRLDRLATLVIVTYRDDELDRAHPLRIVLGELPLGHVSRLALSPLSADAVASLDSASGIDPGELHRVTGGNPFFVTEAVAAGGLSLPETVRDAVLARAARLDPEARELLDAVAIVPTGVELWLLEVLASERLGRLESCLASGMLQSRAGVVAFRHEIARVAVEEGVPPDRMLALHRAALQALAAPRTGRVDLARLSHHAEAAGNGDAVLAHAPAAGEQAASLGAHREAAAQFGRALRFAGALSGASRAALLERRSYECYVTGAVDVAIEARREALQEYQSADDRLRAGDSHRWLSRLLWFVGDNGEAEAEAHRAVRLLEPLPPSSELAMAYSNLAQLRMLADDLPATRAWGARAIELAQQLEQPEILVHALINVGTAELQRGHHEGAAKLHQGLELALADGFDEHAARAYTNLGCTGVETRDYEQGERYLTAGIAYSEERDLDSWGLYMTGWRARLALEQGRWDVAARDATVVLGRPGAFAPSTITPLTVLGRLRARRGDPDPWTPLDEAAARAAEIGEPQRLLPVALARAETRWLAGDLDGVATETETALDVAITHERAWDIGELLVWRRRAGLVDPSLAVVCAEPWRLELAGEHEAAAQRWTTLGCSYEAAMAQLGNPDDHALRQAVETLERLGARRAVSHVSRMLRGRGVRNLRRGPRAATRQNPAGLSARELEVLALVAEGLRNAQIADRLVVSRKTVDHHVSAILGKLAVSTRTEAVAEAGRLGIIER